MADERWRAVERGVIWRLSRLVLVGLVLLLLLLPSLVRGPLEPAPAADQPASEAKVIGEEEPVAITNGRTGVSVEALARVDSGATYSSIDRDLARDLKLDLRNAERVVVGSAFGQESRPLVDARIQIAGQNLDSKVTVSEREGMEHQVLVGREDLDGFLIRVGDEQEAPPEAARDEPPALSVLGSPPPQPDALRLLAALPLVALLIVVVRVLVGVRTFGVFLPALLSLAFVQSGLPAGLAVVGAVLVMALIVGSLLDVLRLQPAAKLAVVLVAVIDLLLIVALLENTPFVGFLPTAALPLLATALVVERFWAVSEREGSARYSWQAAWWTLLIAVGASFLLVWGPVSRLTESFPFLSGAVVAAVCLLVGLYRGPSLVDMARPGKKRPVRAGEEPGG